MSDKLILASASTTRADMLARVGVPVETDPPHVDEGEIKDALLAEGAPARDIADALAELKARTTSFRHPGALVLGADQVLVKDGKLFSKAKDKADAAGKLALLAGGEHRLISAAVICRDGEPVWRALDEARLVMRPLSGAYIEDYLDKIGDAAFWSVGCYQLEGLGAQLFTRVEGDFFTILGLPLLPVLDYLRRVEMLPL
ncbi:Maf family protein [Kordiimonas marina]|uniref:Maf family protein n=1 Tax=Kordiimonas marina TaxID=2872312 RepID=UPI001FF29DD5|nr:Maf family protein [Kordiimonas marina]MCJ9429863.1 Maf family protein [Kordiimonas marina]